MQSFFMWTRKTLIRLHRCIGWFEYFITKTYLYNFDPFKPHLYIVKWVYLFLISAQNISEAVLTSTHNLIFVQKYEKYLSFLSENFQFLEMKFYMYLNRGVFVMVECICQKVHFFMLQLI